MKEVMPPTTTDRVWSFGLIGCGSIAEFHARAIRHLPRARLGAVASRDPDKAERFAQREECAWTPEYRDLLARDDIDIVCITTPSGTHAAVARDAIAAGKHVVVEKPFTMRSTEAAELIEAARERGVVLSVVSQRRFEPQHQAAKAAVESGALGRLLLAEVTVPFFRSQDYYDSAAWRGTIALDGGALMNQGIHSIDLLLWMAGPAAAVAAMTATQTHRMEAEDLGLAILQFANGALGAIMASTSIRPGFPATLNLYGESGTIKISGADVVHWTVPGHAAPTESGGGFGGVSDPRAIDHTLHAAQLADVIEAIRGRRPPLVTGADGLRAVQLVEAIYASNASGRRISVGAGKGDEARRGTGAQNL